MLGDVCFLSRHRASWEGILLCVQIPAGPEQTCELLGQRDDWLTWDMLKATHVERQHSSPADKEIPEAT